MSEEWLACITGFAVRGDERVPTNVRISHPVRASGEEEFRCRVRVTPFLSKDVEIAGISSSQALELSKRFASAIIGDEWLKDERGSPFCC